MHHIIIYIIIIPLLSLSIPKISLCFLLWPKLFSFIKNKQKPLLLCFLNPCHYHKIIFLFPAKVGKCAYTHWLYFLSSHSFLHWQQSGFYCQSFTETILKRLNYQIIWIPLSLHLTQLLWGPQQYGPFCLLWVSFVSITNLSCFTSCLSGHYPTISVVGLLSSDFLFKRSCSFVFWSWFSSFLFFFFHSTSVPEWSQIPPQLHILS